MSASRRDPSEGNAPGSLRVLHVAPVYGWWGALRPDCLDRDDGGQVGGGETALLNACFGLVRHGHRVTCAFACRPGIYRGVRFRGLSDARDLALDAEWDVIVSWDDAEFLLPLAGEIPALLVCSNQMNHVVPWAADAPQAYVSPSRTHARLLQACYGIADDRFVVLPNAVDPSRFAGDLPARDPFRVYYASSPDRGLHHLLRCWPEIRRREPRAHLHVYYEIDRWISGVRNISGWNPEMSAIVEEVTRRRAEMGPSDGVFFEGPKNPRAVARDALASGVLSYPCDTVFFTEGFGTTVLEGYVAGAYPVVTDTDAFKELYDLESDAVPLQSARGEVSPLVPRGRIEAEFTDRVLDGIDRMRERVGWAWETKEGLAALADRLSWSRVGDGWHRLVASRGRSKPWWPGADRVAA